MASWERLRCASLGGRGGAAIGGRCCGRDWERHPDLTRGCLETLPLIRRLSLITFYASPFAPTVPTLQSTRTTLNVFLKFRAIESVASLVHLKCFILATTRLTVVEINHCSSEQTNMAVGLHCHGHVTGYDT